MTEPIKSPYVMSPSLVSNEVMKEFMKKVGAKKMIIVIPKENDELEVDSMYISVEATHDILCRIVSKDHENMDNKKHEDKTDK